MARGARIARALRGGERSPLRMAGRGTRFMPRAARPLRTPILGAEFHSGMAADISRMRSGGRFGKVSRFASAQKGKIIAGGVVAAGAGAALNRRRSGLDPIRGRPTGPYMY